MNAGEDRHETAFLAMVMFAKVLACNSPEKTKKKKKIYQILMWWRGIGEEKMGMVRNKYMSDQEAEDEGLHIRLLC